MDMINVWDISLFLFKIIFVVDMVIVWDGVLWTWLFSYCEKK